ncbi:MAG: ATP-binding protein [Deinococcus-Thermus bacterium]|nr:ATP-binding protein [Deinococcota bacterium]
MHDALPVTGYGSSEFPTLTERLPSTPLAVRDSLGAVCRAVARLGLSPDDAALLELVLAEILNNIVEHAYDGEPTGWIVVEIDVGGRWIACRVLDGGRRMPNGQLPAPKQSDLTGPVDSLPEGGFGWNLIHSLTRTLAYAREESVNCLSFVLDRTEGGGATTGTRASRA